MCLQSAPLLLMFLILLSALGVHRNSTAKKTLSLCVLHRMAFSGGKSVPLCSFLGGLGFLEDMPSPRPPISLGALRDSGSPLINQPVEPQVGRGLPEEDLTAA